MFPYPTQAIKLQEDITADLAELSSLFLGVNSFHVE